MGRQGDAENDYIDKGAALVHLEVCEDVGDAEGNVDRAESLTMHVQQTMINDVEPEAVLLTPGSGSGPLCGKESANSFRSLNDRDPRRECCIISPLLQPA